MGYEAITTCTLAKLSSEGKAQLETDFIQFRSSEFRFKVPLKDLAVVKADGEFLELKWKDQSAKLHLGEKAAAKWAGKILNPPSRLDKLGIKPGATLCLEGEFESAFTHQVAGRLGTRAKADLIFLAAPAKSALTKTAVLAKSMRPEAALWIVYPKARPEIREMDILTAGRAAGLKDIKVARFSDTETALKFVIPVDARKRP